MTAAAAAASVSWRPVDVAVHFLVEVVVKSDAVGSCQGVDSSFLAAANTNVSPVDQLEERMMHSSVSVELDGKRVSQSPCVFDEVFEHATNATQEHFVGKDNGSVIWVSSRR